MRFGAAFSCRAETLARDAEVEFRVTHLAPSRPIGVPWFAGAEVAAETSDPQAGNNEITIPLQLAASANRAELSVAPNEPRLTVPKNTPAAVDFNVSNAGPDHAREVLMIVISSTAPVTLEGTGWQCSEDHALVYACRRSELRAGSDAAVTVRFGGSAEETALQVEARVLAEGNHDTDGGDDRAEAVVYVGSPDSWEPVLIPITRTGIPGANGSVWRTDINALLLSDVMPEIAPGPCDFADINCGNFGVPAPLRRAFDARLSLLLSGDRRDEGGQFLYIRVERAWELRLNARVYDETRQTTTAGAELPIARRHDFTTGSFSLLGIPTSREYRHTLRVYDLDGRGGARVAVKIYVGDESEPRVSTVRTLARMDQLTVFAPFQQPVHPAFLQIDLGQLFTSPEPAVLRLDIEPLDPGLRIWGFVSATNNETHHVTMFTP
jgi:hypothetical protein